VTRHWQDGAADRTVWCRQHRRHAGPARAGRGM